MYSHLTPAVAGSRLVDDVARARHSVLAAEALEEGGRRRLARVRFFKGRDRAVDRAAERPATGSPRPARA